MKENAVGVGPWTENMEAKLGVQREGNITD